MSRSVEQARPALYSSERLVPRNFRGQFSDWPTSVIYLVVIVLVLAWLARN